MSVRDLIYGKKPDGIEESLIAGGLSALRPVYAGGLALHKKLYDSGMKKRKKLPCRVVCIGNLTLGGSGKTPVCVLAARALTDAGKRVAILSRGYKRKGAGEAPLIVSEGRGPVVSSNESGDEPFLMAEALPGVPVIVGADRFEAGMVAVKSFSPDVILMDDGLQHWRLERDCDVVCVDSGKPLHRLRLFPRGPLREPITALRRAQALIFTRFENDAGIAEMIQVFRGVTDPDTPRLKLLYELGEPRPLDPEKEAALSADEAERKKVLLFCGVAKPDSFFKMAGSRFKRVVKTLPLPDHVNYSEEVVRRISRAFADSDADLLVTTEKDAVKLRAARLPRAPIHYFKLETRFPDQTGAARFRDVLLNAEKPPRRNS